MAVTEMKSSLSFRLHRGSKSVRLSGPIPGVDLATGRHLFDTCFDTRSTHPDESTL
jgi:hypothetical protein